MPAKVISKVLEINNCKKEDLIKALYSAKFWEEISPVDKIEASFSAPNVLYTEIVEKIKIINLSIEMAGEFVLIDKGEEPGKGHLIEFNVRNNKDLRKLEGNLRVKAISPSKSKVGVFIHVFIVESDFLNLIGKKTSELLLRTKITDLLRNLEKYCKTSDLKELIEN